MGDFIVHVAGVAPISSRTFFGPHPADPVHAMAHRQLTGHILDAARRLGHQLALELRLRLGIENDRGFDLGL